MNIEHLKINDFEVLKIRDDVGPHTDLNALQERIEELLQVGRTSIAVSFTPASYLDSRAIGTLSTCVQSIHGRHGRLAIIQPNRAIADFLRIVGLSRYVEVYVTEAEVGFG